MLAANRGPGEQGADVGSLGDQLNRDHLDPGVCDKTCGDETCHLTSQGHQFILFGGGKRLLPENNFQVLRGSHQEDFHRRCAELFLQGFLKRTSFWLATATAQSGKGHQK